MGGGRPVQGRQGPGKVPFGPGLHEGDARLVVAVNWMTIKVK